MDTVKQENVSSQVYIIYKSHSYFHRLAALLLNHDFSWSARWCP